MRSKVGMQETNRSGRTRIRTERSMPLKRARFWLICLFFSIWALGIGCRLFWLQIARHAEFAERAQRQQQRNIEVPPRRGNLYDRNLHELAMTVQVDSIYAIPSEIEDKGELARKVSELVHTDPDDTQTTEEQIASRLNSGHGSIRIARAVPAEISARVVALNPKAVFIQKEFVRTYPNNQIAAQVLGFVGADDTGLGGLEQKFEPQLHGVPGHMNKAMDARRRVLGSVESEPEPGRDLVLTIDENIQFLAERALDEAMARTESENGTAIVQDVHTGQILALAVRPTFNPNYSRRSTQSLLRNHAVSDVYEPGSTFKLVTYSAALEQHVAAPDDIIDCQGGQMTLAGRVIHDDKGDHYGRITVHEALEHSSDVAAVKLALKVGPNRFYQFVRDFGFGSRSGAEMPGETRGLLRPVNKWNGSSIGSIAIGQEVGVTPLQLVSMVSTIANGGVYLPPHVLMPGQLNSQRSGTPQASPFKPGGEIPNPAPEGAHRVISTMTAAQMRKMMEGVVLFGTGRQAQLNGYSAGGKTGTAQKIDPATHKYSKTMHVGSFAGFAPVNNPVIAVAVVLDTPKKGDYHGATVSAPVFAEVAQQVLEYLGVPHDVEVRPSRAKNLPAPSMKEDEWGDRDDGASVLDSALNELPADDPLRNAQNQSASNAKVPDQRAPAVNAAVQAKAGGGAERSADNGGQQEQVARIVLTSEKRIGVPSFIGLPVRKAIELAQRSGLETDISGSGEVKLQYPPPGTMIDPETRVIVRCAR